jgi:hypothetical protein
MMASIATMSSATGATATASARPSLSADKNRNEKTVDIGFGTDSMRVTESSDKNRSAISTREKMRKAEMKRATFVAYGAVVVSALAGLGAVVKQSSPRIAYPLLALFGVAEFVGLAAVWKSNKLRNE